MTHEAETPWSAAPLCWFGFFQPVYFLLCQEIHSTTSLNLRMRPIRNQRENLTLNVLLRLKCLSASQELGWSHDINREGGTGWLFYKSLDGQGGITASSSHLKHGLSLLIPG